MTAPLPSSDLPARLARPAGPAFRLLSLGGGGVISFFILWGIARAQKTTAIRPEPPNPELRALALDEMPPPPPPPTAADTRPPPPNPIAFDPAPSPGGIRIAPAVASLEPPAPAVPEISFASDLERLKPSADSGRDGRPRVFQTAQVDRVPVALYRKEPRVTQAAVARFARPYVALLFIVNTHGRAENVQVLHAPTPDIADAALEALREWKFRPASKDGARVDCVVRQDILLRRDAGNPFAR